ncbi:MAG: TldD/PmbA family protein [Synechococcus sp.]|nr:TldD/PmbA family protein [Synechococcus sp.]
MSFLESFWPQRLEQLLAAGRAAGADLVEIFLERGDRLGVLAEQERVTSVSPSFATGAGIRVFRGASEGYRDGFVSTNDLTEQGLLQALDQALGMLALQRPSAASGQPSGFEGLGGLINYGEGKQDWLQRCPDVQLIAERLLQGTERLAAHGQHLQARRGNYSRDWQEVLVAASDGTFARDLRLHQTLGLSVLAADGDHRASVARRFGSTDHPEDLMVWDADGTARDITSSSATMLYADYVDAGTYPVVLANKFGGVIFHEACGHLLETTQLERGTSPFAGRIGEAIAHEAVTAIDEGLSPQSFGSLSMDDEGQQPQRTTLIENGVLKAFLSDRAGELRTGQPRTGSGRRQSYSFAAASRMRNTFIAAGPHSPQELIGSIDRGLYCKVMGGGSVGPTGQFNFSVEEGYLIEDGELGKPVKGATLIGDAETVMPRISMCANDLDLAAGFCGSVSGSVYVTVGQPHVKVDAITVGGR